ncbi:MAG: chitobiase/beta-hexosaminidase C-terminal domain-containing protein [Bacteroidales bacterium]
MNRLQCVIFAFSILIHPNIHAGHYYVSPSGSDMNNGKTKETAFASIHYALSKIEPESGDTLFLLPGTYDLTSSLYIYPGISLIGITDDPSGIIIQPAAMPDEDSGNTIDIVLDLQRDKDANLNKDQFIDGNQTISNFTLLGKKCVNKGIVVTGRNNVKISNLIIKDFIMGGLQLSAYKEYFVNNYEAAKIKGCEISHCQLFENGSLEPTGNFSYASNISIGGWEGGSLHNCTVIDTAQDMDGSGIGMMGLSRTKVHDNRIMINVFEKNHWGGIFSAVTGYTEGLEFFNNEVNSGISCENRVPYEKMNIPGVPNILIFNNRFIGTHPNSVGIQAIELYVDYAEIYNNYFENFFHCITSWHGNDTVTNVDIHHNVFRGAEKGYAIHLTMGGTSYNDPANHSVYRNFNIYNNVFDNYQYAIYNPHGKTENFDIKNNVFCNLTGGVWQHISEEACNNIIFDNNLAHNHLKLQNNNSAIFSNTYTGSEPGFRLEGARPAEWYQPSSTASAVTDKGLNLNEYTLGFAGSAPDLGAYELNGTSPARLAAPNFELPPGTYLGNQNILISNVNTGADIYYTTDGTKPSSTNGIQYTGPFTLTQPTLVKAVAIQQNQISSVVNEKFYEIVHNRAALVEINPGENNYAVPQIISFSCPTPGATIYYSLNGRKPNNATGYLYEGPFYMDSSATIAAIAYAPGVFQSEINSNTYKIQFNDPGNGIVFNDTSSLFTWSEHYWAHKTNRGLGDFNDDIHITYNQGSFFEFDFSGKAFAIITEKNTDKTKSAEITLDDKTLLTISLYNNQRVTSDTVFVYGGLSAGNHKLKVVNTGASGNMAIDAIIVYDDALSIFNNRGNNKLKVYPQPANEYIMVEGLIKGTYNKLQIFDLSGKLKLIASVYPGSTEHKINITDLESGIYILHVKTLENTVWKKILIE